MSRYPSYQALGLELTARLLANAPMSKYSMVHPWIPVHTFLPNDDEVVIIAVIGEDGPEVTAGGRHADGGWWSLGAFGDRSEVAAVTHWIPMPDAPFPSE